MKTDQPETAESLREALVACRGRLQTVLLSSTAMRHLDAAIEALDKENEE
ncbi:MULTISPECIES: hypothetical protein [unclassified Corynebacterium]|nr:MULTISPECIES: hypothetical protein [unclassified Corynebacterium]MDU4703691.1 hypothetical protein [Corynebacterium sp.]